MINARLLPTSLPPDLSIKNYRAIIEGGRNQIAQQQNRSRGKALTYARHIRAKGFNKGYQEGLEAARAECLQAMRAMRECYEQALDAARQDALAIARNLAEKIVDTTLLGHPEALLAWIQQSTAILKRGRNLNLSYHPRYEAMLHQIAPHLPSGITISSDPNLSDSDFVLQSDSGGVEFSWRTALNDSVVNLHGAA